MAVLPTRRLAAALALALTAAALSGCAPAPEPSPTPTAMFASEEEAFAAAEEVYRAYNDAGNRGDDVMSFLIGRALEGELDTVRYLDENDFVLEGASEITAFVGLSVGGEEIVPIVHSWLCLDVSGSRVLNAAGADVTPPDRVDKMGLDVTFSRVDDELLISDSETSEDQSC